MDKKRQKIRQSGERKLLQWVIIYQMKDDYVLETVMQTQMSDYCYSRCDKKY